MENIFLGGVGADLSDAEIKRALEKAVSGKSLKKVLLVPPDITRFNSYAGPIAGMLYELMPGVVVDVLPALGTHVPMDREEAAKMYPALPFENFYPHRWKEDIVKLGEVPAEYVSEVSEGYMNNAIAVEVNKMILDKSYDLIISIGQVVPHEVVGMANYLKNIFVGCGGFDMINYSHYLGALYGMERMMGRDFSPVHKIFDYAAEKYLQDIPLLFVLTVTSPNHEEKRTVVNAVSIGETRDTFEKAVAVSQKQNLTFLEQPLKKVIVYLEPFEFRTTWLGNKAVYRTRMAIADGGELIIVAPGVAGCGEDAENDRIIKKYGYYGRDSVLKSVAENEDLANNLSVAAHLIHGSSEGRFTVTYCTDKLSKEQVEAVGFKHLPLAEAPDISGLRDGMNDLRVEEVFYISNPALGLWAHREKFDAQK